jgi:hypothetical protein
MRCASETRWKRPPSPSKLQGRPLCGYLDARLVVPIQQLVGDLAAWILIGKFTGLGAEPLRIYDRDEAIRQDALARRRWGGGLRACSRRSDAELSEIPAIGRHNCIVLLPI